jgi:hypothetical protein
MELRSKGELKEGEKILQTEKRHGLYLSECHQDCELQNILYAWER